MKICSTNLTTPKRLSLEKVFYQPSVAIIHIFIAFICTCQSFLLLPEGQCFIIEQSENIPLLIRENAPKQKSLSSLTIQDNLQLYSPANNSSAIFLPASDNFISADTIDSNLPIFSLFRNPSPIAKDSFANTLYANLRIQKLLQEYAEVQKRAKELLNNTPRSGPINSMTQNSIVGSKTESFKVDNQESENLSNALKELQRNLATISPVEYLTAQRAVLPKSNDQTSKFSIFSFNELQSIGNRKINLAMPQRTPNSHYPSAGQTYNKLPNAIPSDRHTTQPNAQSSDPNSFDGKLPWILDLPFRLFDFFLAHKIIFLLVSFLGLGLLNILFGSRS